LSCLSYTREQDLRIVNTSIGDEENDSMSFSASRQGSLFEPSSSLRSQMRDEEKQLIENTNLSVCDKIIKDVITFIFGEDLIRKIKLAHTN
jgi:hypothetical protein